MTAHRWHKEMALAAQDAAEIEDWWTRWEIKHPVSATGWYGPMAPFVFEYHREYRRKPVMVTRQISYPGPCRDGLLLGHVYWLVALDCVTTHAWGDCVYDDVKWLAQGRVHLTREAAEAHRVALLGGGE